MFERRPRDNEVVVKFAFSAAQVPHPYSRALPDNARSLTGIRDDDLDFSNCTTTDSEISLDFRSNFNYDFRVAGAMSASGMLFENLILLMPPDPE